MPWPPGHPSFDACKRLVAHVLGPLRAIIVIFGVWRHAGATRRELLGPLRLPPFPSVDPRMSWLQLRLFAFYSSMCYCDCAKRKWLWALCDYIERKIQ